MGSWIFTDATVDLIQGLSKRAGAFLFRDRRRSILAAILLALNFALLFIFLFSSYKGYFHSDASVRNLLAQEMHATGQFFPAGWNYVNKDLMVVFPHLGVWLMLFFFDNSYTLYAVTGTVIAGFILLSVWWFSGLLGGSNWQRILTLAVLAGGVSAGIGEDVFGQAAYGVLMMLTCMVTVLAWKAISGIALPRRICICLLFALVTLLTWSNPQRAAASYLLPLYCGLVAYLLGTDWTARLRASLAVIVSTVAGFCVGTGLSVFTLAHVNNTAGVGAARWLDFNGIINNFLHTLHGLLTLLGGLPVADANVTSGTGVYAALRMFAAVILIFMIGRKVVMLCRSDVDRWRFVGGVVAGMAVCFLFLQMTTTIADMTNPVSSARYLAPTVVLGLVLVFASPLQKTAPFTSLVVIGIALLLATNSMVRSNAGSLINAGWKNPQRDALVTELRAMGLHYGYATYWNAGALTVLSEGEVKVRQVLIPNGLPVPMRHLSSDYWYEPEAWQGETFLLLSDQEISVIDWGSMARYAGSPVREARIGEYHVFVFKRNISEDLPNWSSLLRKPVQTWAAPNSMKTVGAWVESTQTLNTKLGESGFLQYGPYRSLGRGSYTVTYDATGAADSPEKVVATVDVVAAGGRQVLGSAEVRGDGLAQQKIQFTLKQPVQNLEMRVIATGAGEVSYKGLTLAPHH
jgi:hypothetical protein